MFEIGQRVLHKHSNTECYVRHHQKIHDSVVGYVAHSDNHVYTGGDDDFEPVWKDGDYAKSLADHEDLKLTKGKVYQILLDNVDGFMVVCDDGHERWVLQRRFKWVNVVKPGGYFTTGKKDALQLGKNERRYWVESIACAAQQVAQYCTQRVLNSKGIVLPPNVEKGVAMHQGIETFRKHVQHVRGSKTGYVVLDDPLHEYVNKLPTIHRDMLRCLPEPTHTDRRVDQRGLVPEWFRDKEEDKKNLEAALVEMGFPATPKTECFRCLACGQQGEKKDIVKHMRDDHGVAAPAFNSPVWESYKV